MDKISLFLLTQIPLKCISEIVSKSNFFFILLLAMMAPACSYSQTPADSSLIMNRFVLTDTMSINDTVIKKNNTGNDSLKYELKNQTDSTVAETGDSLKGRLKENINSIKEKTGAATDSLSVKTKQVLNDTRQSAAAAKDSLASQLKNSAEEQKQLLNAKKDSLANGLKQKAEAQKTALKKTKDSLSGQVKNRIMNNLNSVKKQILSVRPAGSLAVGYEYGVLPFVAGNRFPSGGWKAEGDVSFFIARLPVELTFSYTTIRQVIGLNNYFRLSYDAGRYKEQLAEQLGEKEQQLQNTLDKLKLQQQAVSQKIMFMHYLQKHPEYRIPAKELKNKQLPGLGKKDSLQFRDSLQLRQDSISQLIAIYSFPAEQKDSLRYSSCPFDPVQDLTCSFPAEMQDSLRYTIPPAIHVHEPDGYYMKNAKDMPHPSLSKIKNGKLAERFELPEPSDSAGAALSGYTGKSASEKRDSISAQMSAYTARYDSLNMAMEEIKTGLARIKAYRKMPDIPENPYLSKIQQFMNHVKKLEIGLCHPSNSVFLLNNVPLQGLNFEYEKNKRFVSLAYGTTLNNMFYNPHTLEGVVQGARNYYNYFDFGNLEAGRKIIAVKGGIGTKESSHLFAGFLIGKGKTDYLFPVADPDAASRETNMVVELDGKYVFSPRLSAELSLGKSSVQENDLNMEQLKRCVNEVFSGFRSYALQTKLNMAVKKTNTAFAFTARWVDPYFKSFGLGFLRSDNLRFEIRADQAITRKVKYTLALRREEDNLLKLYDYKNTLYSISNSVQMKLTRQFTVRLMYTPLFRTLKTDDATVNDRNAISTAVVTWLPKSKKINAQFNLLYSRYLVSGDSGAINFENFSYSNQLLFRSGFKADMNVSWFKNALTDTLGNDTYLGVADIGYTTKKRHSFTIGGKIACRAGIAPQYGFLAKAVLRIYKNLYWEAEAEKIIIGDYYNSFDSSAIEQFPYLCKTRLVINF